MTAKTILSLAALIEILTGLALFVVPAIVVQLLLGGDISGVGIGVARVGGVGLLSLGIACLPIKETTLSALCGMLTYNLLSTAYLGYLLIRRGMIGKLLLPAVALHALITILLTVSWLKHRSDGK